MPTVASIGAISVIFYVDDHEPPHCHLRGPDLRAKMSLSDLTILEAQGRITPAELARVRGWARRHQAALFENWLRARRQQPLLKIED